MKLKVFNIELDGIDKCGKDSVRPYVFYLEPGKYLCRARGLISQIAYAKLYKRNIEWDGTDYAKNTLFVLLEVNKHDWEIRCKLTNEPNTGFTYEEMTQAFKLALYELKNVSTFRKIIYSCSTLRSTRRMRLPTKSRHILSI